MNRGVTLPEAILSDRWYWTGGKPKLYALASDKAVR